MEFGSGGSIKKTRLTDVFLLLDYFMVSLLQPFMIETNKKTKSLQGLGMVCDILYSFLTYIIFVNVSKTTWGFFCQMYYVP